jgi:hypothetical protein
VPNGSSLTTRYRVKQLVSLREPLAKTLRVKHCEGSGASVGPVR